MSRTRVEQPERSIGAHPLLGCLPEDARAELLQTGKRLQLRPRRQVLREGEPPNHVYFLLQGTVRVFHRSAEGKEVLLKLFRAPALFGEMEVIAGRAYVEYVVTLDYCEILRIEAERFRELLHAHPSFSRVFTVDVCARFCTAVQNAKALAFADVRRRLASLLLDYLQLSGEVQDGAARIGLPLSQEQMAHDLAVTRRAVGIELDALRREGVIRKRAARYEILRPEELRRRSQVFHGLFHTMGKQR